MNITADAKKTVFLENVPVGRLVEEGIDQVFYVPIDACFSQRLLPLNGIHLPNKSDYKKLDAVLALRKLLEL